FVSPYPYILPLTLIILLTQRAGRDDKRCRAKYGELWEQYCRKARFRIIPFLY
ncbi:MAG: ergosterol biosynthesis protein, partial [Actinobacteria bacterium]|nr:ergosterol biosynthesis protein [Actinomycetota bacterium]